MTAVVEVRRGSKAFTGWKSVNVGSSIEEAVASVSMEVAGPVAATDDMILAGDAISVHYAEQVVFTGYCDAASPRADASGSSVSLEGRSTMCDAVDCSAPVSVWQGKRLGDLARELLAPFGVGLVDEAGVGDRILPRVKTSPGESVFDLLDRVTREIRIMLTSDEMARLVLTRAGARETAFDAIRYPGNALSMSGRQDVSGRFSRIEVKGQVVTGEVDFSTTGTYEDRRVKRYRPLIVIPEKGVTQAEAAWRANWEALTRAGRSVQYQYVVQDWVQSNGKIWRINTDVVIHDAARGFVGTPMLITGVQFSLSDSGTTTTLTVSPASAYTPEPVKERRKGGTGSSGRWARWDAGGTE